MMKRSVFFALCAGAIVLGASSAASAGVVVRAGKVGVAVRRRAVRPVVVAPRPVVARPVVAVPRPVIRPRPVVVPPTPVLGYPKPVVVVPRLPRLLRKPPLPPRFDACEFRQAGSGRFNV